VGFATGSASGIVVLDLDVRDDGRDGPAAARELFGWEADGAHQRTGGGGIQALYQRPDMARCKSRSGRGGIAPGVEAKADDGYVVAPPSRHASGRRYAWLADPELEPIPPCPAWLAVELNGAAPTRAPNGDNTIPEGARNTTLTSLAGTWRNAGMSAVAIEAALLAENTAGCRPPLPDPEVRKIARSVAKYPRGSAPTGGATLAEINAEFPFPSPIAKFRKIGADKATYDFILEDGRPVLIGTVEVLSSYRRTKSRMIDALGVVIPKMSDAKWNRIVQGLLDIRKEVESDSEADELRAWLDTLSKKASRQQVNVDNPEDVAEGVFGMYGDAPVAVFRGTDSMLYVNLGAAADAINLLHRPMPRLTTPRLGAQLARWGFARRRLQATATGKGKSKKLGARFWFSPPGFSFEPDDGSQ